jgi:2-oxoglutarate dehydrogenase E2 component (dihydrolipoamide succinyltransferase)
LFLLVGEKFEAVVPFMGESVTDGTLATFLKSMLSSLSLSLGVGLLCCVKLIHILLLTLHTEPGDRVEADEAIAQIETDKVLLSLDHF